MKRSLAVLGVACLIVPAVYAQDQAEVARRAAVELMAQAGGLARTAIETRVTRGKPYSAEAVTEFVQVLGDGNRIVRKTSARLFRDSEGRTRREEIIENGGAPERNGVVITDPVAGNNFILHAGTRTATKTPGMFARFEAGTVRMLRSESVVGDPQASNRKVDVITVPNGGAEPTIALTYPAGASGEVTAFAVAGRGGARGAVPPTLAVGHAGTASAVSKEDLGQQQIEGVTANGTRTTTTIPAGAIGNEQPITIVSEQWFSPDLDVLVLTRHNDPRVGESTYKLTGISRTEPDRTLFQVPSDYTLQDVPGMMRRQQQR